MYNRIAGQNLERIAALSDGLFAIAMTLICVISTFVSISFIRLVQIYYAVAPRLPQKFLSGWAR